MRVLGLIPARGGSRGIPRKNIKLLGGRPLLAYAAESALAARRLARVVLSTDDEEIAAVGAKLGLEVPFMRPPELAGDRTPTLAVLQHALDSLTTADPFDAICLLQPTDPFRSAADIDACVDLFCVKNADCVISVHRVPEKYNPHWVYVPREDGTLSLATGEMSPIARRQDLPPAFHRSGAVYVSRADVIRRGSLYGERVFGYETCADDSVNLDSWDDWSKAEEILRRRQAGEADS